MFRLIFFFLTLILFFVWAVYHFAKLSFVDGMVFDLAVLMYNSTTDDRIDFSSLSYNLSPCFHPFFFFCFLLFLVSGSLRDI